MGARASPLNSAWWQSDEISDVSQRSSDYCTEQLRNPLRCHVVKSASTEAWAADGTHLGHVAHHLAWDLVTREGWGLAQDGDVSPRYLQGSHDAFQQGGLPTSTGSQETVTVWDTYHSEQITS